MTASELRTEIARLAGLLAHEVGNAEAQITIERIARRIGLKPLERPTMLSILFEVAERFECSPGAVRSATCKHPFVLARVAAYGEMAKAGYSQSEIARFFGRSPSTIHKMLNRRAA